MYPNACPFNAEFHLFFYQSAHPHFSLHKNQSDYNISPVGFFHAFYWTTTSGKRCCSWPEEVHPIVLPDFLLTRPGFGSSLAEILPLFHIEYQAEQNPNDQHDVALFSKVDTGQTGNRDQLKDHESQAESYACDGHSS